MKKGKTMATDTRMNGRVELTLNPFTIKSPSECVHH